MPTDVPPAGHICADRRGQFLSRAGSQGPHLQTRPQNCESSAFLWENMHFSLLLQLAGTLTLHFQFWTFSRLLHPLSRAGARGSQGWRPDGRVCRCGALRSQWSLPPSSFACVLPVLRLSTSSPSSRKALSFVSLRLRVRYLSASPVPSWRSGLPGLAAYGRVRIISACYFALIQ